MIKPKNFSLTICWTLQWIYFIGWCSKRSTLNLIIEPSIKMESFKPNETTSGSLLYCHEANCIFAFAVTQQTNR